MTYEHLLNTGEFRIHSYSLENVLIAECHGKLTSENAMKLRDEVRKLMSGQKSILLDLKGVPQMDSTGLGAVATLYVSGRTHGCQIKVTNAAPQIRKLFSVTNLLLLFEDVGRHGGKIL